MVLQVAEQQLVVEDANRHSRNSHHSAEAVAALWSLLIEGAEAAPDPRRKHFFEVRNCKNVYYVHRSPVTGKVLLLGVWPKAGEPEAVHQFSADSAAD